MELAGKRALIAGSGAIGGLGHAVARVLAGQGAEVILTGADSDRGEEVAADLRAAEAGSAAGKVRFVAADLADVAAVRKLVETPDRWTC